MVEFFELVSLIVLANVRVTGKYVRALIDTLIKRHRKILVLQKQAMYANILQCHRQVDLY